MTVLFRRGDRYFSGMLTRALRRWPFTRGWLLVIMMGFGAVALAGCASTNAVPRPFPSPDWDSKKAASEPNTPDTPLGPHATPVADAPSAPRTVASAPKDGATTDTSSSPHTLLSQRYNGRAVAEFALGFRGVPYRLGGADPGGFDCSGLVQYVFAQYGIVVPRVVEQQYQVGGKVKPKDVKPGDLLFFETKGHGASHVAIAIGEDRFVHAPNSTGVVRVEALTSTYWGSRYMGARRVTASTTSN